MITQSVEMTVPVTGMSCGGCASTVEKALNRVSGVEQASVDLATGQATIRYQTGATSAGQLVNAVGITGYRIPVKTVTLSIGGMNCAGCAGTVERALSRVEGVISASVNLSDEKATVSYIPGVSGLDVFRSAVNTTGYVVL